MQAEDESEAGSQVDANVRHSGLDGSRKCKGFPVALSWDALPERLIGRHADDLVSPGRVQVSKSGTRETRNQDSLTRNVGNNGSKSLGDEGEADGVEEMDLDSPKSGPAACVGDKVLNRAADAGGDGLLVDECDHRSALEETFLLRFVAGFVARGGDSDGCDGGFDHAQGSDDFLQHVGDLPPISRVPDNHGSGVEANLQGS